MSQIRISLCSLRVLNSSSPASDQERQYRSRLLAVNTCRPSRLNHARPSGNGWTSGGETTFPDAASQTRAVRSSQVVTKLRNVPTRPAAANSRSISSANRLSRDLALVGLEMRHPRESPEQHRRRLADLWLGVDLAEKAYGRLEPRE